MLEQVFQTFFNCSCLFCHDCAVWHFLSFFNISYMDDILKWYILVLDSGVRRNFPRGGQVLPQSCDVTIVWRHKSTLGEVPKAWPF